MDPSIEGPTMKLDPVLLVAPRIQRRVRSLTFWTILGVTGLGGAALGFTTGGGEDPGGALEPQAVEPTEVDHLTERRAWAEARADLDVADLLPDALAYLDATALLGDPSLLPAIERLALAVLEEHPALGTHRTTLAADLVATIPLLPRSATLTRLLPQLERVR